MVLLHGRQDDGLARGEIRYRPDLGEQGEWEMSCPYCGHVSVLDHTVTVDADGGVTIQPSVICECGAHFVVENGEARAV